MVYAKYCDAAFRNMLQNMYKHRNNKLTQMIYLL